MDFAAMKARLAELNSKGAGKGGGGGGNRKKAWKPKDEHVVRCVVKTPGDDPFIEKWFHSDIGMNYPFLCPQKNFGDECPACAFAATLAQWRDENGKERPEHIRKQEWETFKKIQAKARYFVPVVVRGEEAEGAQFWSVTERVYKDLVAICVNEDWNADRKDGGGSHILTSVSDGLDIKVSYQKPGEKGNATAMTLIKVEERKKTSKLADDAKEVKRLIDSIGSVEDLVGCKRVTTAEVKKMMATWLNGGATESEAASAGKPDVEYNEKPAASNNAEKLTGKLSIDEAFDDLMKSS